MSMLVPFDPELPNLAWRLVWGGALFNGLAMPISPSKGLGPSIPEIFGTSYVRSHGMRTITKFCTDFVIFLYFIFFLLFYFLFFIIFCIFMCSLLLSFYAFVLYSEYGFIINK